MYSKYTEITFLSHRKYTYFMNTNTQKKRKYLFGARKKLADKFHTDFATVRKALDGECSTMLQSKIRKAAQKYLIQ